MIKILLLSLTVIVSAITSAAAATIHQTARYDYLSGPWAGEVLTVTYSYASLPAGASLPGYSPEVTGTATFLGATSTALTSYQTIFSGSLDILAPETYLSFVFDPLDTALGLTNVEIFASLQVGLFYIGAPGLQSAACYTDLACTFEASVQPVPAPAPIALLAGALGLLTLARRRRLCPS